MKPALPKPPHSPPAPRPGWPLWLLAGLGVCLALALYADSIALPFFEDDPVHIRWLSWHGLFDPWLTAEALPDYRPLGRFIMQAWAGLLGWHDPIILRAHNILLHTLNTALTAALTLRLHRGVGRGAAAGLAALCFAAYPFAYQAVPWINVLFYPLVTFLLLMMTLAYIQARGRRSWRWMLLALSLAFLAPFEIEHAVMAFSLLAALEGIWWLGGQQRRPWLLGPAAALAGNLTFVMIWFLQPRFAYSFGLPTPARVAQIAVYYLQGLTAPVAPLARLLYDGSGLSNAASVLAVGVPALLLLLIYLRRRGALLWVSLAWFGLLSLPALLYLEFDYVHDSPRLLYPLAPAVAILWGTVAADLLKARWWAPVGAALVVGGVAVSSGFVREQVGYYGMGAAPIAQAAQAAQATPDEQTMLLVNMPSWVSPPRTAYALGNFGAQVFPFWIDAGTMLFAQHGAEQAAETVSFGNVGAAVPYYYGTVGHAVDAGGQAVDVGWPGLKEALRRAGGGVYLAAYQADSVDLRYAGRVGGRAAHEPDEPQAVFNDGAVLLHQSTVYEAEDSMVLTLRWHITSRVENNDTVFVHLTAQDGTLIAQADGYPLLGLSPFWLWESPQVLVDVRYLRYPSAQRGHDHRLWVGLYDTDTGARHPALDPITRETLPDERVLIWKGSDF